MLERAPAEGAPRGGREPGEREREVRKRRPPAAAEGEEPEVADPAPEPSPGARGQRPERGDDGVEDQAARRRRSLTISTTIGITERTITMITTMWTYSPMFGMTRPRRYPAHVMLVTHPTPPATL